MFKLSGLTWGCLRLEPGQQFRVWQQTKKGQSQSQLKSKAFDLVDVVVRPLFVAGALGTLNGSLEATLR